MKGQQLSNLTLYKVGMGGILLLYAFWLSYLPVHAATTLFADPFDSLGSQWQLYQDRQILSPQQPCWNTFSPASWQLDQGKLKLEINGPSCLLDLIPTNVELRGLQQYSLSAKITLKDSIYMDRSLIFLMMDDQNWYGLKIFGTSIQVEKVVDGKVVTLENALAQFPFQANREYFFTVIVTRDQHIDVLVDQQQVLDVEDIQPFIAPQSRQFFSLRGTVGAVLRSVTVVDDVKLDSLQASTGSVKLNVQLWKQTDPLWKDLEYDTAHLWSSLPTMNRWGCAVTSMAMILRYYGISQLPSGEALSPQALNLWLLSQADGYFNGNVNWLAFTRLTQLVSSKLGTPKLEFSRSDGTLQQIVAFATQELNAGKPVILGYPGHFFVADGIDQINNTLLTKDPFYNYQRLNLRPTVNEVNTIRRFQPSHTDLSYMLFNASPDLKLTVSSSDGTTSSLIPAPEYISDPTGETAETSPLSQQYLVRKPSTGSYQLSISQTTQSPYSLDVYKYDVGGNIEVDHFQGTAGPTVKQLSLEYHKEVLPVSPTPSPAPTATPQSTPAPETRVNSTLRLLEEMRRITGVIRAAKKLKTAIQQLLFTRFVHNLERLN